MAEYLLHLYGSIANKSILYIDAQNCVSVLAMD
jgi:hypothetical protein